MIRRGTDYIKSIKENPPVVYYEGEVVKDVTEHSAFKIPISTVAKYYDLHWDEKYKEYLRVYNLDVGEETSISFLRPKNKKDLGKLRDGLVKIYDYYRGFFGRSPDYLNLWTMVFYAHAEDYFGKQFGSKFMENAIEIYKEATKRDLFYTHAIVAPMYDRSRPPSQWEDPYIQVGIVEEKPEGVVVRGAAMICTAGPYAEMLWYLPNVRRDSDPRYAIYFSIPTNTKGVKFLSRRGFQPREGGEFEYPISSRFEESDAVLVLDNVLIPWERIIFFKKPELIEDLMWHTVQLRGWFNWHFVIQHYSRLKFLAGLAIAIAEASGTSNFINVQEKIGEILIYVALNEAALYASVERAQELPNITRPDPYISISASHFNMKTVPRANEILRSISAGSSIPIPAGIKDFENPEERKLLDKYMAMKGLDALERVKMFNLLWDVIGSEAGMRYEQYDRFSRGDPTIRWAQTYTEVFKDRKHEFVKLVKDIIDQMPNPKA
ncbi:4-hydroxyphenylacetate 3-hydroxylase [Sulfolobus islandicus Y.G.57.14]|jgi:Aromatic ring hydroxylase|nr:MULTISPECIES: 4-hydroxyphenylacetate 3-hydroxylase family protein [Sulfolobaceae]ACP45281.1 4-hydroxyphenylacetate 3-hydroxylase [Sulfolobus islandicus Y.G.57.14]ACP48926.1 4-hydroxyphenylacetate 3-hydroxylase [Sulfolobus islandicus Y.N.15.51]PVU77081.1 4-hydroxyphenylacetate 3-hydroxylase [Sulfolobus islandicus]QPG49366.1 4-hydroxyphenylacetate 3-hydroxylase [Saccharolobus solfataricus]